MDESTPFERIGRIIQESIRLVLKADGGASTLIGFSDGVVKIALEKTRIPVTFSNFLVTFKVRTSCSCGRCQVHIGGYTEWCFEAVEGRDTGYQER